MEIKRRESKLIFIISIIFIFCLSLFPVLSFSQTEKEKEMPEGNPKAESPTFSIDENMKKFKSRLEKLEAEYKECCGSLLNVYMPMEQNKILENLPKPKTLTVNVTYPLPPWKETKAVSNSRVFVGYFDHYFNKTRFYATYPFVLGRGESFFGDSSLPVAAADKETSIILGIPQEVGIKLEGDFYKEVGPEKNYSCCLRVNKEGVCERVAEVYNYIFPTDFHPGQMKLKVDVKGAEVLGGGLGIRFTEPGDKEVSMESPMKIDFNRDYCSYTNCVNGEVINKCEPSGTVKKNLEIRAVRFKGFGIEGLDFEGKKPQLDYFFNAEKGWNIYKTYSINRPGVLVDYGKGQGIIHGYADLITTSYGPVMFDSDLTLSYIGGTGATKFKTKVSYLEGKEHEITVNAVEMVYDHSMSENIASADRKYKITALVAGPANMKNYSFTWKGEGRRSLENVELGITWEKEKTDFIKVGGLWSSTNTFQISYKGYDPKKIKDLLPFSIEGRIVRNSDNQEVYRDEKVIYISYPAITELKLYTQTDGRNYLEPSSSIDIFTAPLTPVFKTRGVYLYPYLVLADGSVRPIGEVTEANVELKQSNPGVVKISKTGRRVEGISGGKTDITARIGMDLQKSIGMVQGDELKSKPIRLNVNVIQPLTVAMDGNKRRYRLSVESYSYFEGKYRVVWIGKGFSTITSFVDEGLYSNATLSTDLEITDIHITDTKSEVVAEIKVDQRSNVGRIKLLPPDIPVTTIEKQDLLDYGSLETITKCVERVKEKMRFSGFEPGKTPETYCQEQRREDKKELEKIKESQKEMNRLAKELEKQGKELIVLADRATVGAVIEIPANFNKTGLFCYWRLIDAHAQLMFQDDVSPIQWIDEKKGGCFNVITGIQKYLTPEAKVQVELRMDNRNKGKVEVVSPAEIFTF